mgnify:CR=1 FL=1
MAKRKPLIPGVAKPTPTDIAKMKGEVDMKNAPAPEPAPVAPDVTNADAYFDQQAKDMAYDNQPVEDPFEIKPLPNNQGASNEALLHQIKALQNQIDMAEAEGIEPQPKKPEPITPPAPAPTQPVEPLREPIEKEATEPEQDPVATAKQIVGRVEELQLEQMRLMTILRRMMEGQ